MNLTLTQLSDFLKKAKKNTYASEQAAKVPPLRPGSKDYEFTEGNLTYHDTYFGGRWFIGQEVVYENGIPVWGMGYNGYVTDPNLTEADIDKSLRAALQQDTGHLIPVRGPAKFEVDDLTYENKIAGPGLERFEGQEKIVRDTYKNVYYCVYHGGLIE